MNKDYINLQESLIQEIRQCELSLRHNPDFIPALGRMGDAYMQLHKYEDAIGVYSRVIKLDRKNVQALNAVATAYVLTSQLGEALETAMKALEILPGNNRSLEIVASVYERRRESDKIIELLEPVISRGNHVPALVLSYARAISRRDESGAISLLEKSVTHPSSTGEHQISMHFLLGKLYDQLAEYDKAMVHFDKGNELRYVYFETSRPTKERDLILKSFTRSFFDTMSYQGNQDERPVFIVGMPRSGTTLVDRIISSHPDAVSAGELVALPRLTEALCGSPQAGGGHFTACVSTVGDERFRNIAEQYLEVLKADRGDASCITDKMPVNFMYLGVIQILFPNAKIINCIRNSADVCLSCYMQDFHGFKPYLNNLEEIAMVYRNYRALMDYWKTVLKLSIHDIRYEDIVNSPETEIRGLIEFIGLPWDDRCLDFHSEGQFINTVSYDQVDRPIYDSSVNRWKNYEKHLVPLKEALGEYWQH